MEEYKGFNGEFLQLIRDTDLPAAKGMLDRMLFVTNTKLVNDSKRSGIKSPAFERAREVLKNVFGILLDKDSLEPYTEIDASRFRILRGNIEKLRRSFDAPFPKVFQPRENPILAAWVSNDFKDETVNFTTRYLELNDVDRPLTLVHERAHTALKIPGHPGTGDSPINIVPHEGKPIGFDNAIKNAYCYEWFAVSIHPRYDPSSYTDACVTGSRAARP